MSDEEDNFVNAQDDQLNADLQNDPVDLQQNNQDNEGKLKRIVNSCRLAIYNRHVYMAEMHS